MKIVTFVFLVLSAFITKAQIPNFQWGQVVAPGGYISTTMGIAYDSQKNIYTCGFFSGPSVDFDPGPATYTLSAGNNGKDAFILKLDSSGNFIWAKRMGGTGEDWGYAIYVDQLDNIYTVGTFQSNADFDPGAGVAILSAPTNSTSVYISKLDAHGDFLWAKGIDNINVSAIDKDRYDNLVICGSFPGTADFDPGPGVYNLTPTGSRSVYILKLSSAGNFVSAIAADVQVTHGYNLPYQLKIDNFGNTHIIGTCNGTIDFDPGPGVYTQTVIGNNAIYIQKLDSLNNFQWAATFGGVNGYNTGSSLDVDRFGNVYATGAFAGTVDFDPGSGVYNLTSSGSSDIFVLKLNAAGTFDWVKRMGSTSGNQGNCIKLDTLSNINVVGSFALMTDFDPGPSTYTLTTTNLNDLDGFILKLTNSGNFIWVGKIGGTNPDECKALAIDKRNNLYVNGSVDGWFTSVDLDPTPGSLSSAPLYGPTPFVVRMGPCPSSISTVSGPASLCVGATGAYSVAASVGATGYVWNTSPGSSITLGQNTNSVSITFGSAMSASIIVTPTNTCGSGNSGMLTVNFSLSPTVTAICNPTVVCSNSNAVLSSSGATTYSWSTGVAAQTININPSSTTVYTVTGFNTPNCFNTATVSVFVNPTPTLTVNSGSICSGQTFTMNPTGALTYTFSSGSSTVSPLTNTNFTITGAGVNGCTATTISSVAVNPIPVITINSGTICSNQTFTMMPSGAMTYTYSSGTNTVSPSVSSTYTVTGTDFNGCVNPVGAISSVNVNAAPSLTTTQNASVCVGTSTILNVSGANTYSWTTGATTSGISVSPAMTTNYSVTGTNANNCSSTQTITLTVNQSCQDVWPGDANSDGLVDNTDVLELGLHFGQTGPARASTSNAWQSYFANNWAGTISNGKNVNHSDCNGDGVINSNDTLAIFNNYGLTHAFKQPEQSATNPQLSIVPDQSAVAKGSWGTSSVFLGEASAPITNINGLAFTVSFDQDLIDANSFYIEYPASFLNTGSQNLDFSKPDFANGKLYTATTHTVTNNVSGNGKIAVLHYKIKSTLSTDEVLNIGITQGKQSNASGMLTPLTAGTATVAAIGASVGMDELSNGNSIGIYPNPANSAVTIQSSTTLEKVELLSVTGQIILIEIASGNRHQLNLMEVANGVYFVTVYDANQKVMRKKLMVQH